MPLLTPPVQRSIVIIGKENTGKSQLIASLTGKSAYSTNFRGSTVACETYSGDGVTFVDTPGILYRSDAATTRIALAQLEFHDTVLLVVKATHVDEDLADLLPLVAGKRGIVVIPFWDKVAPSDFTRQVIRQWEKASNLAIVPVDARHLTIEQRQSILAAIDHPSAFPHRWQPDLAGWRIEPRPTWLEHPRIGWLLAIALLLLPAIIAVYAANSFAAIADPLVQEIIKPVTAALSGLTPLLKEIAIGRYGLVTMGPLLFVWAVPTVILYALFLGGYKASGLVERITIALDPILRPVGLSGRDLVRVIMGFGCNVPAVISTRACSSCSRKTCISAIAFGSACSYQFGATLGVFSAANRAFLIIPYLLYLTFTTLLYTRLIAPKSARSRQNTLVIERRIFLETPQLKTIWREAKGTIEQFLTNAIPIFLVISAIASILDWLGGLISPLMSLFNLPPDAALPVILASIRKDGLLLFAEPKTISLLSPLQILTAVYLAGVLLPCLVTALTIAREQSWKFALGLMARQSIAAILFTLILAWGGRLFLRY
ncbi:GTPase [Chamaesiphon sp.]|uniref:GTPase n=1 Tax=Chamaesiphon sp. TaxID=2814140 RepID=UPI0035935B4B